MKAVRLYAAGDLRVEDIPTPTAPEAGWVKLELAAAGICGSDLHNFRTGQWIGRSPSVVGHELTGTVVALGAGVEHLAVGDHVVADSRFWCGECPACRRGQRHLCVSLGFVGEVCDGGFAEETVLPARLLHVVDPALNPRIAVLAEPLAVALHAVRRLPASCSPVLVAGCGPIGGLVALLLAQDASRQVLVADRNTTRRDLVARVTGATAVDLDRDAVVAATSAPCFLAVEATGSIDVLAQLLQIVEPGGSIALVGIFGRRIDLDPNLLVEREIALLGCHAFADELPEVISMLPVLAGQLGQLIEREISLDEVPLAYERLLAGKSEGLKTVIRIEVPSLHSRPD
jgi:(R,R)-butanediol dehydrogenase/meso-butanediol dehydrogenase/diacetyl reductase